MKRRNFIRDLGLGGATMIGAMTPVALVHAAKNGNVPQGRPFQELLRQINALQMQMDDGIFPRLRVIDPDGGPSVLFFGPTDECSIGIDPPGGLTGLIERDPIGFRLLGPNNQGCRLLFGPTDLCTVEINPDGPGGLLLRDPGGVRLLNPDPQGVPMLLFGPTDECRISLGDAPGIGMIIWDPDGLNVRTPRQGEASRLSFGPTGDCDIQAGGLGPQGGTQGMFFKDPQGFLFQSPDANGNRTTVQVEGLVLAEEFVQLSSRALKQDIKPIDDALTKIDRLQGVYFNWRTKQSPQAQIGLIAEDVAEVLPEAVSMTADDGSPQGIKYGNLVAVAIEGIKAQQQQIAQLEADKVALQQEVERLRNQLHDVSAKVDQLTAFAGAASRA